jgi:hypothetical protein
MAPRPAPRCDFCKDPVAPLGWAPPPRLGLRIRRPIHTCPAAVCQAQAAARVQAVIDRANPFAPAPPAPPPDPPQGSLF